MFSFFAYFLGLVLIKYEHVQKLFIFLSGNSHSVFEALPGVFIEETVSLLICKVLKQILKEEPRMENGTKCSISLSIGRLCQSK